MSQQNIEKISPIVLDEIIRAVEALRFGAIEITVHDGRVTQIERREKIRFQSETNAHQTAAFKPTVKTAAK